MTASFGERLSALIVAAHLNTRHPAIFVDSRQFVVTDDQFTQAAVVFAKTNRATRTYFAKLFRRHSGRLIPIVTGFIAATPDGRTTTIGRNGSDYSAAIVGAGVGVSSIEIWTDVDGVLSADPKAVPAAFPLPQSAMKRRWSFPISAPRCCTPPRLRRRSRSEFRFSSRTR